MNQASTRRGALLIAMVMWFICILVLFGFESLALPLPVTLVLVFLYILVVIGLNRHRTKRQTQGIDVSTSKGRITLNVRDALTEVVERVKECSERMGYTGTLKVLYITKTWNVLNAHAFRFDNRDYLVMTGGVQALHCSKNPDDQRKFDFVIFHELAHILGKDTSLVSTGLVMLRTMLILFPVKFVVLIALPSEDVLDAYASLVPASVQWVPIGISGPGSSVFIESSYSVWVGLILASSWYLLGLLALYFLYRTIVRYREHFADRFAASAMGDKISAARTLEKLLRGGGNVTFSAYSLSSAAAWHPSRDDRLRYIQSEDDLAYMRVLSVILCAVLLGWHVFGNLGKGFLSDSFALSLFLTFLIHFYFILCGLWLLSHRGLTVPVGIRASTFSTVGFWMTLPFIVWTFFMMLQSLELASFASSSNAMNNPSSMMRSTIFRFMGFVNLFLLVFLTSRLGALLARRISDNREMVQYIGWSVLTYIIWQIVAGVVSIIVIWGFGSRIK